MSIIKPLTYYPTGFGKQLAATIVWAQFFAFYCLGFWAISAPTESNVQWADPFIKFLPIQISVWIVILSSLLLGVWCVRWLGVGSLLEHTPFIQLAIGVVTAVAITVTIRVLVGDSLPDFVPVEESSKPGFLYGMVAGYGEEVLFRMLLMPLFFFGVYKLLKARGHKQRVFLSAIAAIVLTAVLFVLLHELGDTDGTIVWKLVATRFIVPGVVMGSLYFLFGPGFVIAMHSSMHVMIPLLFN